MKVSELIEELRKYPEDYEVLIKDPTLKRYCCPALSEYKYTRQGKEVKAVLFVETW